MPDFDGEDQESEIESVEGADDDHKELEEQGDEVSSSNCDVIRIVDYGIDQEVFPVTIGQHSGTVAGEGEL